MESPIANRQTIVRWGVCGVDLLAVDPDSGLQNCLQQHRRLVLLLCTTVVHAAGFGIAVVPQKNYFLVINTPSNIVIIVEILDWPKSNSSSNQAPR